MSFNSPFTGNVIQPTDVSYASYALTSTTGSVQLEWPINGNATDYPAARIMQVTTTSTSYVLKMPPANQTSVGQDALITNPGATTLTVKDYAGVNTICTIANGQSKYIYISDNPTSAGTWKVIAFGVGSSSVDAAALAGAGLMASGAILNQSQPVTTFSSGFTATEADRAATYVWTGGGGTVTLTSASTLGNNWFFIVRNGGTGTLSITPSGGDLINGSGSLDMQPADSCFVACSGSAFYSVGLGKSTQFNFTQLTKAVVSGTYTLTSSEAANVIQKYTGTLSGNVTVIMPSTIQIYYITNQTSGAYSITFRTSTSGGATAVVPAGQQVILLCDSVNMYNASTIAAGASTLALGNGTVGAPSLNFSAEGTTGIYRPASGEFGIAVLGAQIASFAATGLTITGTGTFSSGISGGTF